MQGLALALPRGGCLLGGRGEEPGAPGTEGGKAGCSGRPWGGPWGWGFPSAFSEGTSWTKFPLMLGTDTCPFAQQSEKFSVKGQDWGSSSPIPGGKALAALCWLSTRIWGQSPFPRLLSQASLSSVLCGRAIPSPANHLNILPPCSGAGVLGSLYLVRPGDGRRFSAF